MGTTSLSFKDRCSPSWIYFLRNGLASLRNPGLDLRKILNAPWHSFLFEAQYTTGIGVPVLSILSLSLSLSSLSFSSSVRSGCHSSGGGGGGEFETSVSLGPKKKEKGRRILAASGEEKGSGEKRFFYPGVKKEKKSLRKNLQDLQKTYLRRLSRRNENRSGIEGGFGMGEGEARRGWRLLASTFILVFVGWWKFFSPFVVVLVGFSLVSVSWFYSYMNKMEHAWAVGTGTTNMAVSTIYECKNTIFLQENNRWFGKSRALESPKLPYLQTAVVCESPLN